MSTQQTTNAPIQGKYGYHICSYEQYKYMKHAHKIFYLAIIDRRKWQRWARKDENNKNQKEPNCYHNGELDQKLRSLKHSTLKSSNQIAIYKYEEVLRQYKLCKRPYQMKEIEEVTNSVENIELWNDPYFKDLIKKIETNYS